MRGDPARLGYRDWNPGLDHRERLLGEVIDSLPKASPSAIPRIIRAMENPTSPIALPGAVTLARHDIIHVLLGRGLLPNDEAFVIGFTMGATRRLRRWQERLFLLVSKTLYPGPYRFDAVNGISFRIGVSEGRVHGCADLAASVLEELPGTLTVGEAQSQLGISSYRLNSVYKYEQSLIPDRSESRRLDTDPEGYDPSSIRPR